MEEEKKEVKKQDTNATEKVEKKDTKPVEKKEEKKAVDKKSTTEVKKEEVKKENNKQQTQKDTKTKFEKAKGEKKKSNTGVIIGIIVIVLAIVAILAYMFLMTDSPKKSVETMLNDVKAGNYSQSILASVLEEEDFDQEAQRLLFDKLEWKILNVNEEGNQATVEVEITNKDFKTIIENCIQKMIKSMFANGQNTSEEQATNYLMEELKNDEISTVTSNQSILLEKKDGKWEVSEENDFVNILLPGFNEAISSFN